jgi:hypothetical protein
MARSKSARNRIRQQLVKAIAFQKKVLLHVAFADCIGKGGSVKQSTMYMPEGVKPEDVKDKGHPLLNQNLEAIVGVCDASLQLLNALLENI